MKKVIIQINIHADKQKQKALKTVSGIQGVDSLSMDMEAKKLTIIGDVNPVEVMCKLKKCWCPVLISFGPKEEPKKEEPKKEEPKKKEDDVKCRCGCGNQSFACQIYTPPCYPPMNYAIYSGVEDCPPSCVIC